MKAYLRPLCGVQARRLAALLTLAVGLPRLPWFGFSPPFAPLRFVSPELYGFVMIALGAALYVTAFHHRLGLVGRTAAALGFTAWAVLAAATSSATSLLISLTVASVLLSEVWTQKGRCDGD